MTNNTSSPSSSSRFNQFILFLASLGVVVVVYLLRRKPTQELPVTGLSPAHAAVNSSVDVPSSDATRTSTQAQQTLAVFLRV